VELRLRNLRKPWFRWFIQWTKQH